MSKIFSLDFRKGTHIDSVNNIAGESNLLPTTYKKIHNGNALFPTGTSPTTDKTGLIFENTPDFDDFSLVTVFKHNKGTLAYLNSITITDSVGRRNQLYSQNISGNIFFFAKGVYESYNAYDFRDGKEHIFIATWDDSEQKRRLYIDGVEVALNNGSAVGLQDPNKVWIGSGTTTYGFDGYIGYKTQVYNHVLSEKERNEILKEYYNSHVIEKPVRNFAYPKPTDLSKEVHIKLKQISQNSEFDTDSWWLITQPSAIYISDGSLMYRDCGNGQGFRMPPNTVNIGDKLLISFKMSNLVSGKLRFYDGVDYIGSYYDSEGEYVFEMTAKSTYGFYLMGAYNTNCDVEYCKVFIKKGLVAAYNMIPSNGELVDISGNGNDGTINGALSTKDGMSFSNDRDDNVQIPNSSSLIVKENDFTIEARIKVPSILSAHQGIFGYSSGINPGTFHLYISGTLGVLRFIDYDGFLSSNHSICDGQEHTISMVRSGSDLAFFIDGIRDNDINNFFNGKNYDSTNDFYIGMRDLTRSLNGEILDLKFYNYAFTPEQAKDYHNSFRKPVIIEDFSNSAVGDTI